MLALFTCQSEERQREFNAVSLKSNIGILNIDKNRKNLTENNKKTTVQHGGQKLTTDWFIQ